MASFTPVYKDGRGHAQSNGAPTVPSNTEVIEIDDDSEDEVEPKRFTGEEDEYMSGEEEMESYDEDEDEIEEDAQYEDEIEDEDVDDEDDGDDAEGDAEGDYEEERERMDEGEDVVELESEDPYTNGLHPVDEPEQDFSARGKDLAYRSLASVNPSLLSTDVTKTLHPLQDTAERVLKQIESFAHNLDQFRRQSPAPQNSQSFRDACKLVKTYQSIAERSVRELTISQAIRKHKLTPTKNGAGLCRGDTEDQVVRWELEANTWDLLHRLLSITDPETQELANNSQATALKSLHRYSSDREVWDKFLEADNFARECVAVLQWLEKDINSTKELDAVISDLEEQAQQGQGLWTHGWLYTKETIKGAKRLRSWPQPLDPQDTRVTPSLLGSEKQAPVITQLDPDAIIRQKLGLRKEDKIYEQAAWLTCWKMLRSGQSWTRIRAWAQERFEAWRAISVSGSSFTSGDNDTPDSGPVRLMSCRSQEWKTACSVLANDPNTDPYEKAVYALLSGEKTPAYAVCNSWSDHLYVYYNHVILSRYSDFCKQFRRKLTRPPGASAAVNVEPPDHAGILNFLENLRKDKQVSEEAKNPYRQIQAAILGRNFRKFFYHHATVVSKHTDPTKEVAPSPQTSLINGTDDPLLITANDESSLRIVSHLYLLLSMIGLVHGDTHFTEYVSVNVVRYIELLQGKGLSDLVPLYASMLPDELTYTVLGKILIDVQSDAERQSFVQRMNAFGIDISAVLSSQWQWAISEAGPDELKPIEIKRRFAPESKFGEIPIPYPNLVGSDVDPKHERLIRCMEWYRFMGNEWVALCSNSAYLYKRFLRHLNTAAARELWKRIQFSKIPYPPGLNVVALTADAQAASAISQTIDPEEGRSTDPVNLAIPGPRRKSTDPNKSPLEYIGLQAQTVEDLEHMISLLDAAESWGNLSNEFFDLQDKEQKRPYQHRMQKALDAVTEHITPLCEGWLTLPIDDEESTELKMIRTAYIPEVIIMYHNSLHYAACSIGREIIVHCMDLSTAVAGSPSMVECFVSARRMQELVTALAYSSMAMMSLSGTQLKKKLPRGASLDLWKVEPIEKDAEGITLFWKKDKRKEFL